MQEYVVIKKGSHIRHCITIPEAYLDMDLEIRIRPLGKSIRISEKLEQLQQKYPGLNPFKNIDNPLKWQRKIRDERP